MDPQEKNKCMDLLLTLLLLIYGLLKCYLVDRIHTVVFKTRNKFHILIEIRNLTA